MREIKKAGFQGDVLFIRVSRIPSEAAEVERKDGEPIVVAHSETQHHHVISSPDVKLLETANPLVAYLRMESPSCEVEHLRPFDTHQTRLLVGEKKGASFFEIRRQREHAPEGWRRAAD
jgi:hypothetical protein